MTPERIRFWKQNKKKNYELTDEEYNELISFGIENLEWYAYNGGWFPTDNAPINKQQSIVHRLRLDYPEEACNGMQNMPDDNLVLKNPAKRTFETGATRDTDLNKLDFEGFLSPIVLERYSQYLNKHRKMADGTVRESDNWQKTFGEEHFNVCMKSALRHIIDAWKQHRGFKGQDSLEDSLCATIFNLQAYLYKLLVDKGDI